MSETLSWAIIDAAAEPEVFTMLEELDPPHASLYAEPIPEGLGQLAPHLVQVDDDVLHWLMQRETPWGMVVESKAEMKVLRQHLRKYMHVQIPGEDKPVIFRFYDPRNIWPLLTILSPWEQHSFLGPIDVITTQWQGIARRESFTDLKAKFTPGSTTRRKVMQISAEQMAKLTLIFEQRYIDGLVEKITAWNAGRDTSDGKVIAETFRWLKQQKITDDRSIRGLFHLFYLRGCLALDAMPAHFRTVLSDEGEEGVFKAETLLIQELGGVPL